MRFELFIGNEKRPHEYWTKFGNSDHSDLDRRSRLPLHTDASAPCTVRQVFQESTHSDLFYPLLSTLV